MNELYRLRRSERYEVRADEKQDKEAGSLPPRLTHFCPQCGQFSGFHSGVGIMRMLAVPWSVTPELPEFTQFLEVSYDRTKAEVRLLADTRGEKHD